MKSSRTETEQRYLLLFKLDAANLFERIYDRRHDYIEVFSLKRNRAVFKDIFSNRYERASVTDLSHCTVEVIEALNQFYKNADNLFWYLKHTQDMPNTIEDEVQRKVARLKRDYEMLALYIDAELSGTGASASSEAEILGDDGEPFVTDGEDFFLGQEDEFIQPEHYPDVGSDQESDKNDANS